MPTPKVSDTCLLTHDCCSPQRELEDPSWTMLSACHSLPYLCSAAWGKSFPTAGLSVPINHMGIPRGLLLPVFLSVTVLGPSSVRHLSERCQTQRLLGLLLREAAGAACWH